MAKVTGPMMSLSASGKFADTLVFSTWKGRPYVRQLVTPANPSSPDQITARKYVGSIAKAAVAVLTAANDMDGYGSQFYVDARDGAPSGQSWISFLQKFAKEVYDAAIAGWATIDGTEQGYFTTAAAGLGLTDYTPTLGGESQTGLTKGQQLLALGHFASLHLGQSLTTLLGNAPTSQSVTDFVTYLTESIAP